MKPASEIHAEVGKQISIADSGKYRAFTVSDIAKIIADAKVESLEYRGILDRIINNFLGELGCPAFDLPTGLPDSSEESVKKCFDLIRGLLKYRKAESKGVCEWRIGSLGYKDTTCKLTYLYQNGQFCPGCGKEIKVV